MIHLLVMALLSAILVLEYLVRERGVLSSYFLLVPELLSGIAMLIVFARIVAGVRISLDWRYGAFIAVLLATIIFGYLVQDVPTGAMVAGARNYLKFIPFFLLAAVYPFTWRQIRAQLMLVVAILMVQTPLAFYQRFVEFANAMNDGDPIKGTTTSSSSLSMFMVVAVAGVVILYLRGKLRLLAVLPLIAWLFMPTTINETKATIVLLPFALLVPAFTMPPGTRAARKLLPIAAIGAMAGFAFVVVYNSLIAYREYSHTLGDMVNGPDMIKYYFYTGAAEHDAQYVGRFDSIEFAVEHTARDPITFAFGMGAANVAESFMPQFAGKYWSYFLRYGVGQTQVTTFLWEVGAVGLLAYLALFWFIARDSLLLARSGDEAAELGQLWTVAMVVMGFGLLYKAVFSLNDVGYLFWHFSGVVASRAVAVRRAQRATARRPIPAAWRLAADTPPGELGMPRA
ncbi:MAG TPA: hypothetical protein VFX89_22705 [Gammaproteobacteria bacterium]|nr:hypothetical protein [Gammaproteobacteria bacterium]